MLLAEDLAFFQETIPFLDRLTPAQRRLLEGSLVSRRFERGAAVHRGAGDCAGMMLVRKGQLRAFILSDTGKEITLYRLFDRDVCLFTASCAMRNINFEIHIEAEKDSALVQVPTPVYKRLAEESAAFSEYVSQVISARFSDVMWVMEQVLFMSFDRRLALFLLDQAAIEGGDTLRITHEGIANHLGTAREVVTRMLRYFQNEGMVRLFRGGVALTDRAKLEKLAGAAG